MEVANGRYVLQRRLGSGGTGSVYEAIDRTLGRRVAVKCLYPSIDVGILQAEGSSLARLDHPNVVAVHDLVASDGQAYLILEYVDGCDLEQWISRHGRLRLEQTLKIIHAVGSAVQAAHAHGILYCDLKPANILLSTSGDVKLTDFTLARHLTARGYEGQSGGSAPFAAPEQLCGGETSARTDVFGLGVLLQRLLDRRGLEDTERQQILRAIDCATKPDPADRYETVTAFLAALPECSADTLLVAPPRVSSPTRISPLALTAISLRRRVSWRAFAACCLLAGSSLVALTHFTVHAGPARVTVPDLVGADGRSGSLIVRSLGLHPHVVRAYSVRVPAGVVSQQKPAPIASVNAGTSITMVVSRGPAPVAVPDVGGLPAEEAVTRLRARGFRVTSSFSETLSTSPGHVLAQSLPPGALRVPGTQIVLSVSRKPWWWIF